MAVAARSTLADFVLHEKIGAGSYGVVWRVVRKVDKQTYALKEIDLHGMSKKVRLPHVSPIQPPACSHSSRLYPPAPAAPLAAGPRPPQEQEECICETQLLSEFDSSHIIKYWDSFLERVRSGWLLR
jgi:serine/threonine protein kinase